MEDKTLIHQNLVDVLSQIIVKKEIEEISNTVQNAESIGLINPLLSLLEPVIEATLPFADGEDEIIRRVHDAHTPADFNSIHVHPPPAPLQMNFGQPGADGDIVVENIPILINPAPQFYASYRTDPLMRVRDRRRPPHHRSWVTEVIMSNPHLAVMLRNMRDAQLRMVLRRIYRDIFGEEMPTTPSSSEMGVISEGHSDVDITKVETTGKKVDVDDLDALFEEIDELVK